MNRPLPLFGSGTPQRLPTRPSGQGPRLGGRGAATNLYTPPPCERISSPTGALLRPATDACVDHRRRGREDLPSGKIRRCCVDRLNSPAIAHIAQCCLFDNVSEGRTICRAKSLSCGFDPPSSFRVLQRFVILLGLPRVARRKLGERVIKGVALAAIACNHRRVACLGVRQRQCPAAKAAVIWKRLNIVDRIAALHVRKLADVKLPSFDLAPTEEDIGRTLGETLAEDHPVSL